MIRLFSNNHFLNSLLLFPILILLHSKFLFEVQEIDSFQGLGYLGEQIQLLLSNYILWYKSIYVIVLFLLCTMINRLSIIHGIGSEITLLPGLLFVFVSGLPPLTGALPIYLSMLIIVLGVHNLLHTIKKQGLIMYLFNAGFYFALASLFFYPSIVLLPFGLFSLNLLRNIRLKNLIQYTLSAFVPYLLTISYTYLFEDFYTFVSWQWEANFGLTSFSFLKNQFDYFLAVYFCLIFLVVLLNIAQVSSKKIIYAQRKINVLYVYLFFSLVGYAISKDASFYFFIFSLIVLLVFLAELIVLIKNKIIAELLLWIILGITIAAQFINV